MMNIRYYVLIAFCFLFGAHASAEVTIEQDLQQVLDQFLVDNPSVPAIMVSVHSDRLGLAWSGAAGVADRATQHPVSPDQPLRIASTTKTYVAAAILRLMEMNKLDIEDSIDQHLSKKHLVILRSDGYDTKNITIRGLLTHTSGLADHALDGRYADAIMKEPTHHWTRTEQIQFMVDGTEPLGEPGELYMYSDTGYVLLGEIIERRAGRDLGAALRDLLRFDELQLDSTWLEIQEPAPAGVGRHVSQYMNDMRTNDWHASFDLYGGGGLVSNTSDLMNFFWALFDGRVFENPRTLELMKTITLPDKGSVLKEGETAKSAVLYAMGLFVSSHANYTIYEHGGYWGTDAGYVPALDLAFGWAVTQSETWSVRYPLLHNLIDAVARLDEEAPSHSH